MSKIKLSIVHGIPQELALKKAQIFLADLKAKILQKEDCEFTALEINWADNQVEIKAEYRSMIEACVLAVEITESEIIMEGDLNQIIIDKLFGIRHSHTGGTHFA